MHNHRKEQLINCGIHFIGALTDVYGSAKAMEIWDDMSKFLPDDLRSEIFLSILLGVNRTVTVHSFGANPVYAMRVLVKFTGLTHKEIHDLVTHHRETGNSVSIKLLDKANRIAFIEEFNLYGCKAD